MSAQAVNRADTMSVDVDGWFDRARPGAELVYSTGAFLRQADPAVRAARRLIEAGLAVPYQRRVAEGRFDYCLRKRARPDAPASRGRARPMAAALVQDEAEQLMAVLRRLANLGQPCPSNGELAKRAQLKDGEATRYRLKQLEAAGRIRVRWAEDTIRVVTIVASGRRTARRARC